MPCPGATAPAPLGVRQGAVMKTILESMVCLLPLLLLLLLLFRRRPHRRLVLLPRFCQRFVRELCLLSSLMRPMLQPVLALLLVKFISIGIICVRSCMRME